MPCPGVCCASSLKCASAVSSPRKLTLTARPASLKTPARGKPSLSPLRAASDPHFSGLPHAGASYPRVQKPLDIVSQYLETFVEALFSGHKPVVFCFCFCFFFFTIFSKEYKTRIDVWLGTQAVKSDEPRFTSQLPLTSCVALDKLLYHPALHFSPL